MYVKFLNFASYLLNEDICYKFDIFFFTPFFFKFKGGIKQTTAHVGHWGPLIVMVRLLTAGNRKERKKIIIIRIIQLSCFCMQQNLIKFV